MASMQQERYPPPSYADATPRPTEHDPASIQLPEVPKHKIGDGFGRPEGNADDGLHLPDLRSLGLPDHGRSQSQYSSDHPSHAWQQQAQHHGYSTPQNYSQPTSNVTAAAARPVAVAVADVGSPMEVSSTLSMEDLKHRDLSVSMEDADVRMAAEALSGLGNPEFLRSPRTAQFPTSYTSSSVPEKTHIALVQSPPQHPQEPDPEPLLRLITDSHPWLGNTISGSMIAYDGAKHYSPRFVRGTAEFVERNIGGPMVNTVGFVSRQTGVDGRIRRYLGDRRLSDDGRSGPDSKRRRVDGSTRAGAEQDVEKALPNMEAATSPYEDPRVRADSRASHHSTMSGVESLPAYDDNRSPVYEEHSPSPAPAERSPDAANTPPEQAQQRSLTSQVLETTAGLGVALSDSSLRSLKYSLRVLSGASEHIGVVMQALKRVLEEYEQDQRCEDLLSANEKASEGQNGSSGLSTAQEERSQRLAKRIKELGDNIWNVLRETIRTISRYTGSALPENAASLVRRQLMSLPLRWRNAAVSGSRSSSNGSTSASPSLEAQQGDNQVIVGANRMMNFGKESLEMLAQVSLVVRGTVRSAEQWLDTMGRQKRQDSGANGEASASQQPQLRIQQLPQNGTATVAGQQWNGDHKDST